MQWSTRRDKRPTRRYIDRGDCGCGGTMFRKQAVDRPITLRGSSGPADRRQTHCPEVGPPLLLSPVWRPEIGINRSDERPWVPDPVKLRNPSDPCRKQIIDWGRNHLAKISITGGADLPEQTDLPNKSCGNQIRYQQLLGTNRRWYSRPRTRTFHIMLLLVLAVQISQLGLS